MRFSHRRAAFALAGVAVVFTAPAAAHAADQDSRAPWSARVTINLDAGRLGLSAGAPRSALALAGARRAAAKVGVNRAELGRLQRVPRRTGGVTHLRQTVGGLRVLWSQLDVLTDGRKVTSAGGTLVPLRSRKLAGAVNVRRSRAVRIARTRIAGPDTAGAPQLVAYAGDPGRPRAPRRAWVVAVDPAHTEAGDDSPMPLCVVVDAQTGRVLKVWKGSVTAADAPRDAQARAAAGTTVLAQYEDAKGRSSSSSSALGNDVYDLLTNGDPFATYDTTGGFFGTHGAPAPLGATMPGKPTWQMRAPIDGTTNAARFFCRVSVLFWCGRNGGRPGLAPGYHRWFFTINWTGPISKFVASHERIYLQRGNPSIDEQVHSHEIGHEIDYFSRDDLQETDEGDEIKEALAEMFSFTYYGFRPALPGECSVSELLSGSRLCQIVNQDSGVFETVPHEYKDYGCATDSHTNGYILGRAFLTILQTIGPDDATRLLREVPRLLPAKRTFGSVHQAFEDATVALGMTQDKSIVHDAFIAQGVTTSKTRTGTCPNANP